MKILLKPYAINNTNTKLTFLIDLLEQYSAKSYEAVLILLCSLGAEEAGFLLSNAVFPLAMCELGSVPSVQEKHQVSKTQLSF